MKPNPLTIAIPVLLCFLCMKASTTAQDGPAAAATADPAEVAASILFVQNARGMTYDEASATLTLSDISPVVTFFSDRPHRIAGHVLLSGFLQAWNEGRDSFQEDPPNAELSVVAPGDIQSVVVELSDPVSSGQRLSYKVKVLEGQLPASGGPCSLFIDGLLLGGARGAAGGAIIGAACGDAGKGAAVGAAMGGARGLAQSRREMAYEAGRASTAPAQPVAAQPAASATANAQSQPATVTLNVPNSNGSQTPVKLKEVPEGWQGPKGEIYSKFPSVDELKKIYGM